MRLRDALRRWDRIVGNLGSHDAERDGLRAILDAARKWQRARRLLATAFDGPDNGEWAAKVNALLKGGGR